MLLRSRRYPKVTAPTKICEHPLLRAIRMFCWLPALLHVLYTAFIILSSLRPKFRKSHPLHFPAYSTYCELSLVSEIMLSQPMKSFVAANQESGALNQTARTYTCDERMWLQFIVAFEQPAAALSFPFLHLFMWLGGWCRGSRRRPVPRAHHGPLPNSKLQTPPPRGVWRKKNRRKHFISDAFEIPITQLIAIPNMCFVQLTNIAPYTCTCTSGTFFFRVINQLYGNARPFFFV